MWLIYGLEGLPPPDPNPPPGPTFFFVVPGPAKSEVLGLWVRGYNDTSLQVVAPILELKLNS